MAQVQGKKKALPIYEVSKAVRLTPHMVRITLQGDGIKDITAGCEGANCKIFLPSSGQSRAEFEIQLQDGPRPTVRTYTVRHLRTDLGEMDIDFVDHGEGGPASAWARAALPGSFCGFGGPGKAKMTAFYAEKYLVAADMSALPVAAAALEAMPRDAIGDAYFEIMDIDDKQEILAPAGVRMHWFINPNPLTPDGQMTSKIRAWGWPVGKVQTCIAGESGTIKELRKFLLVDKQIPREDTYISGYWKIGLIEDEHQALKRAGGEG